MLFYTGITRSADPILAEQNANIAATRPQLDLLRDLAGFAVERLRGGDVDAIGRRGPGELGGQAEAGLRGLERPDRRGGHPCARRRCVRRQADRRGRRRLPARHLPRGAAARGARDAWRTCGNCRSSWTASARVSSSTCCAISGDESTPGKSTRLGREAPNSGPCITMGRSGLIWTRATLYHDLTQGCDMMKATVVGFGCVSMSAAEGASHAHALRGFPETARLGPGHWPTRRTSTAGSLRG